MARRVAQLSGTKDERRMDLFICEASLERRMDHRERRMERERRMDHRERRMERERRMDHRERRMERERRMDLLYARRPSSVGWRESVGWIRAAQRRLSVWGWKSLSLRDCK